VKSLLFLLTLNFCIVETCISQVKECQIYSEVLSLVRQSIDSISNSTFLEVDSIGYKGVNIKPKKSEISMKAILYVNDWLMPVDPHSDSKMWLIQKFIDSSFAIDNKFLDSNKTNTPKCTWSDFIKVIDTNSVLNYNYYYKDSFLYKAYKVTLSDILYTNTMLFVHAFVQNREDDEGDIYGFSFKKQNPNVYVINHFRKFK